ncbi:MAG: hypothetical protein LC808_05375 [Actinobacteria bacterium]|nr:hypothetical protein [Actinomycetota bacterium]
MKAQWRVALLALGLLPLFPQAAHAVFRGTPGKIAYAVGGSIHEVNPDGTGRTTYPRAGDADPAFSPLGLRVALARSTSGNRDIWVRHADGSGARRLTGGVCPRRRPRLVGNGREGRLDARGSSQPAHLRGRGERQPPVQALDPRVLRRL